MHLRHRVPYDCQQMKELTLDLLISGDFTTKIKQKTAIVMQIPSHELHDQIGEQVPFVLLK